jgi:hypothetical protein
MPLTRAAQGDFGSPIAQARRFPQNVASKVINSLPQGAFPMTEPGDYLPEHFVPSPGPREGASNKKASTGSGSLKGAFLGASLAFFFGMLTNFYSNYLTRRDQHVQEADKCNGLASSLLTTTSLARDAAQAAADAIAAPASPNRNTNRFVLPAIDEVLHSQDQSLDIIDPNSRNIILQLEAYYRAIRDDLSNTADVTHQGETFALLPSSPNKDFYENLLHMIAQEAQAASHSLEANSFCDDLAKTNIFWPSIRRHPTASPR